MVRASRAFIVAALGAVLLTLLFATHARADALPPRMRGVGYVLKIDNLDEFPEHAFILYPTSNSGFGYVVETSPVNVIGVMRRDNWKGPPTRLFAMTKTELAAHDPDAPRHPHADDYKTPVMVVDEPPESALRAEAAIEPPDLVPEDSEIVRIERTFHIARLDDRAFELELVKEETIDKTTDAEAQAKELAPRQDDVADTKDTKGTKDTKQSEAPAKTAPAAAPEKKGCRIAPQTPDLGAALPLIALLALRRRRV